MAKGVRVRIRLGGQPVLNGTLLDIDSLHLYYVAKFAPRVPGEDNWHSLADIQRVGSLFGDEMVLMNGPQPEIIVEVLPVDLPPDLPEYN